MRRPALHWSYQAQVDSETECWLWTGRLDPDGYGRWSARMAHRVIYEECVGPVPRDQTLDHLCRVRACVNPDHLEPVSHLENSRRGSQTRLTSEQVSKIRASTERVPVLAAHFGVSQGQIYNIRAGKCWPGVAAS